jgi:hypothetical protein
MSPFVLSNTDLKKLLTNGSWTLKLWSTNAQLTAGLAAASLSRSIVPAGFALFGRRLTNVFVWDGGSFVQVRKFHSF